MENGHLLADSAARKAAERAQAATMGAKTKRFLRDVGALCGRAWNGTPVAVRALFVFVFTSVALGFLSVLTFWELGNAGSGYSLIFAGWGGALAFWGGVSVAGWYMFSHRQHKEADREVEELEAQRHEALRAQNALMESDLSRRIKKGKQASRRWAIMTALCAMVTGFGVFSNLVSHASMDTAHAIEVDEDRSELRKTISRLNRELGVMPKPEGVEFTRETLASYEAEAAGWKMADLKPDGACLADLKKRQRELCNLAADIRAELLEAEEMQAGVDLKIAEIEATETKLKNMQPIAGAKHYERMAELVLSIPGVPSDWEKASVASSIQVWGVLFLAIVGLYACAVGWDAVGEMLQKMQRKRPTEIKIGN